MAMVDLSSQQQDKLAGKAGQGRAVQCRAMKSNEKE